MTSAYTSRTATTPDLLELLSFLLSEASSPIIVVDGYDECTGMDSLLTSLEIIVSKTPSKVLIFSRPNVDYVQDNTTSIERICVSSKALEDDIRLYFSSKLETLYQQRKLPQTCDMEAILNHLVRVCNGMFLWARLTIRYLSSRGLTPSERAATIWEIQLPEGLAAMYERILTLAARAPKPERELAKRVCAFLMYGMTSLMTHEIHEAFSVSAQTIDTAIDDSEYESSIVLSCAGLVEKSNDTYRFIHLSVSEFLCSGNPKAIEFVHGRAESHLEISLACLRYITKKVPQQPLPRLSGSAASTENVFGLFEFRPYASSYWPIHAYKATEHAKVDQSLRFNHLEQLLTLVDGLLDAKLQIMTWIEALYHLKSAGPCFHDLKRWGKVLSRDILGTMPDLCVIAARYLDICRDLTQLHATWHETLKRNPGEIWGDITAFTETYSSDKSGKPQSNQPLARLKSHIAFTYNIPNFEEYTRASRSQYMAFNKLMLNRQFDAARGRLHQYMKDESLLQLCSGWVATYEKWNIQGDREQIFRDVIHLDDTEIHKHLRIAIERGFLSDTWELQFPTAISSNVHVFGILRTIYCLDRTTRPFTSTYSSVVLPVDLEDGSATIPKSTDHESYPKEQHFFEAYLVKINSLGEYICFQDRKSVKVFRLALQPRHCEVSEMNALGIAVERNLFCFHENLPLLAFAANNEIKLWDLKRGHRLVTVKWKFNCLSTKSLSFSKSGEELVVLEFGSEMPTVISLKQFRVYQMRKYQSIVNDSSSAEKLSKDTGFGRSLQESPLAVLNTPTMEIAPYGGFQALKGIYRNANSLKLNLSQREGISTEVELLNLPKWGPLNDATASVVGPQTRDDKVNIVFGATAKPWYTVLDRELEGDAYLPLFVQKDQRVVRVKITDHEQWISYNMNRYLQRLRAKQPKLLVPEENASLTVTPTGQEIYFGYPESLLRQD
ncbi:hypothetical protein LSUE1_G005943 [Lachnellula suecica]|uniref:NACHT domain-containing protein n=1 Tax=Lachnellula suecica TaxID=602035 RepID=A0A8T9C2J3_9HELO|nr:hypothetical protein LSUE1_G005943 [Lachnellula suecica]